MFTIAATGGSRDCNGLRRRDFLQVGTLALGRLSLPDLLAARTAAKGGSSPVRDKSVVLLYLSGGASHIETFDPKMTAPSGICSVTGELQTRLPGVTFGGTFPQLAAQADKLSIVRSFTHKVGSHEQAHVHVLSGGTDPAGRQTRGFSMGSFCTRLRGTNNPQTGFPTYALLTEKEIDGQYRKELRRVTKGSWPGSLGGVYAPMGHEIGWAAQRDASRRGTPKPDASNPLAANMVLNVPEDVLRNRVALLRRIDGFKRQSDASGQMRALDRFSAQAIDLVMGGSADAFDFRQEDKQLVERYDTSHIQIGHKSFRPSTLGKQMLVARRLCEAGCGFVT
ncbi:MAG: DUF1501 domain-containing protein, partial [Planctomycetaceae bacterium]